MLRWMPLHSMIRCVVLPIFPSRSDVTANAFDESPSEATRHASGASAVASSWRLFMGVSSRSGLRACSKWTRRQFRLLLANELLERLRFGAAGLLDRIDRK